MFIKISASSAGLSPAGTGARSAFIRASVHHLLLNSSHMLLAVTLLVTLRATPAVVHTCWLMCPIGMGWANGPSYFSC